MAKRGAISFSSDILGSSNIGLWALEMDEGLPPRMYADETMLRLLGLEEEVSPEETYRAWYNNVNPDYYNEVNASVEKMTAGVHAEVQYPWKHPDGHTMYIRCGGVRNSEYKQGIRLEGCHQDVTELLQIQKKTEEELRNEKAKNSLNELLYEKAILEKACCYFRVNVTKNRIVSPIVNVIVDSELKRIIKTVNGKVKYDFFVSSFVNKFVCDEYKDGFLKHFSAQSLKRLFEKGVTMPEFVCKILLSEKQEVCRKYVCYLSVDDTSHDLMAMVVVYNTTESQKQEMALRESIEILYSEKNTKFAVKNLLENMAVFYQADRACIFEEDDDGGIVSNTFEWCKDGISKQIHLFQNVPSDIFNEWKDAFKTDGFVSIETLDENTVKNPELYELLNKKQVQCFVAAPIASLDGKFGFIGLDNPKIYRKNQMVLKLVGGFVKNEILRRKSQDEDSAVIAFLAAEYSSVYHIDLNTNIVVPYRYDEITNKRFGRYNNKGFPYTRASQKYISEVVSLKDRAKMMNFASVANIRKALAKKKSIVMQYQSDIDGKLEYYEAKFVKASVKGEIVQQVVLGIANIDKDVRKEKECKQKLEEALSVAQAASRAKTNFLSSMSHDIRTPMNAIIGYTALAKSHINDKNLVWDFLGKIEQSSDHLLSLVDNVLDMSCIESDKIILDEKPENLFKIIQTIQNFVQTDVRSKNLDFFVDTINLNEANIFCDKLRLSQILLNVVSNAVKYTPNGGTISIRVKETAILRTGYAAYEFHIKDTGIGMSESFLRTIYEPFSRATNSEINGVQGTGLGMAIAKSLVDLMEGRIEVTSEEGKGTEVVLYFEFKLQDICNEACENEKKLDAVFAGKKILVVEDNAMNREIAIDVLEDLGVVVDSADDGVVAVSKLSSTNFRQYDLILMDIQMPFMNGYEATKEIRSMKNPEIASIPIIAMTANAFDGDRKLALDAGMNEYMSKPIDLDKMKEVLRSFL